MYLEFFAGCVGGCAGLVVGHPLDTLKVIMQSDNAKNPQYKGTLHLVKHLVVREGLKGVYKGISSPLLGVALINAIVFGVQDRTQKKFEDDSLFSHFAAGGAAGFCQSFICSPVELAKTRLQVSDPNLGLMRCLKNIFRAEGVTGLYRGLSLTIAREVPSFATYFVTYEYLTQSKDSKNISTPMMLLSGGTAGILAWVVIYPIDVIKTRIQLDGFKSELKYRNAFDCLRQSVAAEGYGILTRGLTPTLLRAFPTNAAIFTAVTWTMRLFEDISQAKTVETSKYFDNVVLNKIQRSEII